MKKSSKNIHKKTKKRKLDLSNIKEPTRFSDDFQPSDLVDQLIESDFDASSIPTIDEGELNRAKNFVEWTMGKEYLNIVPYPRQIEIGIHLEGDFCFKCSDMRVVNNMALPEGVADWKLGLSDLLDRIQLLEYGKCPKCGKTRYDFYKEGLWFPYSEFVGICGQRSGKSAFVGSMHSTYQVHKFLRIADPVSFFGLLSNSYLRLIFTALELSQAQESLWQPFNDYFKNSKWFREYHKFLTFHGNKLGEQLFKSGETFFLYKHKKLSGTYCKPDKKRLRGRTGFYVAMDEICLFDSSLDNKKVRDNADQVHNSLANTLQNVRSAAFNKFTKKGIYDLPTGMMANISSPIDFNDKGMRILRESRTNKFIYGFHYSTLEMNPNETMETLKVRCTGDLSDFQRDFEAIPPLGDKPLIKERKYVLACESTRNQNDSFQYVKEISEDHFGDKSQYANLKIKFKDEIPRILSVDTGFTRNAYAVSLAHMQPFEGIDLAKLKNYKKIADNDVFGKIIYDFVFELSPKDAEPIHFSNMFEYLIKPICENFNIVHCVYDRWESIQQVQDLKDMGIKAEWYSLTYNDIDDFKKSILSGLVEFPKCEVDFNSMTKKSTVIDIESLLRKYPVFHTFMQILTVRDLGHKVTKPIHGDDDIFRCLCLNHTYMKYPENVAMYANHAYGRQKSKFTQPLMVVRGKSSYGGNSIMPDSKIASKHIIVRKRTGSN